MGNPLCVLVHLCAVRYGTSAPLGCMLTRNLYTDSISCLLSTSGTDTQNSDALIFHQIIEVTIRTTFGILTKKANMALLHTNSQRVACQTRRSTYRNGGGDRLSGSVSIIVDATKIPNPGFLLSILKKSFLFATTFLSVECIRSFPSIACFCTRFRKSLRRMEE